MDIEYDRYRRYGFDRSLWTNCRASSSQGKRRTGRSLRTHFCNHVLHAARRLVRLAVCDNFSRGAAHALHLFQESQRLPMNQEFEQEYGSLSKKVRELREYL